MGLYAHATHLHLPNMDHGRLLAGAMLKSPHPVLICPPYGKWLNAYLPMGLSYKDVPEFPTATAIELNCYDSEGLDLRLYANDRLAVMFESGCGDVAEQDDRLAEIASSLWEKDPDRPKPDSVAPPKADAEGEGAEEMAKAAKEAAEKAPDYWDLSPEQQEPYRARARQTDEFRRFVEQSTREEHLPEVDDFAPLLPEGRSLEEFATLLVAISARLTGPPSEEKLGMALEKWMGKRHSEKAEDYLAAIAKFLGLRGSLWSLESIQEQKADAISGRIVKLEALES